LTYNFSTKYNLFFIHIPKNAGTSINELLEIDPKYRGHRTPKDLLKMYPQYKNSISIAVVRNPWDRMVSTYEFRKSKGYDTYMGKEYSFKDWVLNPHTPTSGGYMEWMNQYDVLYDDEFLVSSVLRYEFLEEDLQEVFSELDLGSVCLGRSNVSIRGNYKDYYDKETKEFIREFFYKDIKAFGYEF